MKVEELEELLEDCPRLFHMAEAGSWNSIRDRGLLSTTALLDLFEVEGSARAAIESSRRSHPFELTNEQLPRAVVRDQLPMDDTGLRRALPVNLEPADWYRLLNGRVFFWLTEERLNRLLGAAAYKGAEHDVLEIDAPALVSAYLERIWLCPINSGCTKPMPHPRDLNTFSRIANYPYEQWRRKRKKGERVVELCVDYGIPDIGEFTTRVTRRRGATVVGELYRR